LCLCGRFFYDNDDDDWLVAKVKARWWAQIFRHEAAGGASVWRGLSERLKVGRTQ
jgi:hypothetical protein